MTKTDTKFVFPHLDTMLKQLDKASKGPLQLNHKYEESPSGLANDKLIAVKQLGDRKRLALTCMQAEVSYNKPKPVAAIQLQTKIGNRWAPIVTTSTDKRSHFTDLVSDEVIRDMLRVKQYRFVKPLPHDMTMFGSDAIAVDAEGRTMALCGFVTADPETFEIRPATNHEGEVLALVWVGTDHSGSGMIAVDDRWWWPVRSPDDTKLMDALMDAVRQRSCLEAALNGAHVSMAWMPWGHFTGVPEWEPPNWNLKLTEADRVYVKRLLEMAQTDPDSWWDGYDYPPGD